MSENPTKQLRCEASLVIDMLLPDKVERARARKEIRGMLGTTVHGMDWTWLRIDMEDLLFAKQRLLDPLPGDQDLETEKDIPSRLRVINCVARVVDMYILFLMARTQRNEVSEVHQVPALFTSVGRIGLYWTKTINWGSGNDNTANIDVMVGAMKNMDIDIETTKALWRTTMDSIKKHKGNEDCVRASRVCQFRLKRAIAAKKEWEVDVARLKAIAAAQEAKRGEEEARLKAIAAAQEGEEEALAAARATKAQDRRMKKAAVKDEKRMLRLQAVAAIAARTQEEEEEDDKEWLESVMGID